MCNSRMITQKIQLVAFDLFGVILQEGHLVSNVLMQLLPPGTPKSMVKKWYQRFNIGEINEEQFWAALEIDDADNIRRVFINSFELDKDYKNVVESLCGKYRLSILSNLPPEWANEFMSRFQFSQYFSPCVFSGQERCKKPDPEIYQNFISQSDLPATRCAFIDDRLENLQTAHKQGFTTIYYYREEETHPYQADYSIRHLADLAELFAVEEAG